MKNQSEWRPTKFIVRGDRLLPASDTSQLQLDSRIIARLTAEAYSDWIPRLARGRLLDLGCGNVPMYSFYRGFVEEIVCADWSNSEHSGRHLDDVVDLTAVLPYESESFDTVLLSDVLEHLPEASNCVSEIARVLKPGGRAILNVPFAYPLHEEPYDYHRYTEHRLRLFAEESGLQVEELTPLGGSHHLCGVVLGKSMPQRFAGTVARSAINLLVAAIDGTALRKLLERRNRRFPLAYFLILRKADACTEGLGSAGDPEALTQSET